MRPVPARRTGAPLSAVPTLRRALLRALAVTALIAGIVAMHSLGLGHGPVAVEHTGRGVMAEMVGMEVEATRAGVTTLAMTAMTTTAAVVTGVVTEAGAPAHGMAAMCLAVLPLLMLLIGRRLGWRVITRANVVGYRGGHGCVPDTRAPPAHLRPSLLKLCILRT